MISRVAGSCFWLHRYVERAESMARLLRVNSRYLLDVDVPEIERWHPLVIVSGEQERFAEIAPGKMNDPEAVQEYLTWDSRNPVSILESVRWARENARTTREVISLEMWEQLNGFWHWLTAERARRLFVRDRDAFYQRVKEAADLFQGLTESTLLDEEPLDFMRLGMFLERAAQTARILDVKHHTFGPEQSGEESPVELAQWMALLHSCSAAEPFLKRSRGVPAGRAIGGFLVLEPALPRSLVHCLAKALEHLRRIRATGSGQMGRQAFRTLDALLRRLQETNVDQLFQRGIHEELTHVVNGTIEVGRLLEAEYFDGPATQTQQSTQISGLDALPETGHNA